MKRINRHGIVGAKLLSEKKSNILSSNYFTIEALEDGLTAKLSTNACEYCVDGGTWNTLTKATNTVSINKGQTLSFRGNLTPNLSYGIGTFTISKKCNVKGNIMSLLYGDDFTYKTDLTGKDYAFYRLFYNCTKIVDTSELILPATTLASRCYYYMFGNCTGLTTAPELPATTLARECYQSMFYGCSSLVNAPELPATTLASRCYYYMFYGTNVLPDCSNIDFTKHNNGGLAGLFAVTKVTDDDLYNILPINPDTGKYWLPATTLSSSCYDSMFYKCSSLVTAPELPATTLADYCYQYMFQDCTGLTTAPELPASDIKFSFCYQSMFNGCSSLTHAPELPATTLANSCYHSMFYSCTSLTTAPELPATNLASSCYYSMFYGCKSLTTAPELPATTLTNRCYSYMFYGCTSLTQAPELPATTLATYCYQSMFSGCSKLSYIKALFTTTPSSSYTSNWVSGVSRTGTFVKNKDATWDVTGVNGIPEGWTVVNNVEKNLITFTIGGVQYQAEEGMTWGEWVDSEYNTGNYKVVSVNSYNYISNNFAIGPGGDVIAGNFVSYENFDWVVSTDIITELNYIHD